MKRRPFNSSLRKIIHRENFVNPSWQFIFILFYCHPNKYSGNFLVQIGRSGAAILPQLMLVDLVEWSTPAASADLQASDRLLRRTAMQHRSGSPRLIAGASDATSRLAPERRKRPVALHIRRLHHVQPRCTAPNSRHRPVGRNPEITAEDNAYGRTRDTEA